MIFARMLEFLELANIVYKGRKCVESIMLLVEEPLWIGVWVLQLVDSATATVMLTYAIWRSAQDKFLVIGMTAAALLMLAGVLAMR